MMTANLGIPAPKSDLGAVAIAAVRYAFTRDSTACGTLVPAVQRLWPNIGSVDRSIIRRDVEEALRDEERGLWRWHECDRRTWREFAAWLAERPEASP